MKTTKILITMLTAGGLLGFIRVQAQSFPTVPLSVEGRFSYNTNQVLDAGMTSLQSVTVHFNSHDLVALLASSPAVSNVVADVTGSNGFPADTHLVVVANFSAYDVVAVGAKGFSFPLQGYDPVTGQNYSFAGLTGSLPIASSFVTPGGTQAGTESDQLSVNFFFDDGAGDSFSITSVAEIDWRASKAKNGAQNVAVAFDVFGGGAGQYGGYPSTVEADASGAGSGSENVLYDQFPFWIWFQESQLPPVNT